MRPRFDLIQTRFIRQEDEAFGLDITRYKDLNEARELINGDDHGCLYPFNALIFHPRNKIFSWNLIILYHSFSIILNVVYCLFIVYRSTAARV